MDRRNFIAGVSAMLALTSCARDDKRARLYDEKKCPFCSTKPGTCTYCRGTGSCSFCGGKGKRKTTWPNSPEENIKAGSYEEQCVYCNGTGKCRYCNGSKKCWACNGTGEINSWDFYEQCKRGEKK